MPVDERVARSVALEQAYVHDVYEQFLDNHTGKPWPKVQQFIEDLEPGSIICDVGCGNGKYFNVNTSVFNMGGDKCVRLCEVAREKENEVLVLDNLTLPFRDESVDAVLSVAVVHHLATTERRVCALRELARVLRIGGRLIISVWAMEQTHRKFESQDVLVPWHRPHQLSTPSLEITSTTTNSEDDGLLPYHAYTQTSDSDSNRSVKTKGLVRKRGRSRHKGRSIDPVRNSSPSSSSLTSPNETCYSFVRRALQKLAGGGRRMGVHRPWFLESWSTCAKEPPPKRYDPDGCECCDCDNIQDLPIELRRIDDDDGPQRRQTFPSSQLINDLCSSLKSRSMTNIKTVENNNIVRSRSGVPAVQETMVKNVSDTKQPSTSNLLKPRLVKQKKSVCSEDADEDLDKPTDMKMLVKNLPDFKVTRTEQRGSVFKQRSLNEELMSTERLREKEQVRQNIQKQASLNDALMYQTHQHTFDSFRTSFFSVSTTSRFQLIKTGFTNKIKNSTTNIEKVTGSSLKNGFVRMFQNWKNSDLISPTVLETDSSPTSKNGTVADDKKDVTVVGERRHSKEDGSDSSKDSSLQSDTSVDSEDSFASVIFVPKSDPMSPAPLSPDPTSPRLKNSSIPNSPRIKQSSCPTSPRIKQMPLAVYPLTKQLSSPKPSSSDRQSPPDDSVNKSDRDQLNTENTTGESSKPKVVTTLAQKYSVPQIPKFRKTNLNSAVSPENPSKDVSENVDNRTERLKKIRELLSQRPGFGVKASRSNFPIVRHSSVNNGKVESIARPLPKLLTIELFNPATDDKDSDSSAVSSPDSVESVISVDDNRKLTSKSQFTFPATEETAKSMSLLEAAADVANSLDNAVQKVIKSSPRARRRQLKAAEVKSVIERAYSTDTTPLLDHDGCSKELTTWNECHKHLTDFADQLSEKLLQEIDHYQEKNKNIAAGLEQSESMGSINDPYIHRLSAELQDLSKLSAEIQKQNEYLAKLSVSDSLFGSQCFRCKSSDCKCESTKVQSEVKTKTDGKSEPRLNKYELRKDKVPLSDLNMCELKDSKTEESIGSLEKYEFKSQDDAELELVSKLSVSRNSIRTGASTDSCDLERGSSTNSMVSIAATSINGQSMESGDGSSEKGSSDSHKDTNSISRYSDGGSTASLASCPEWKTIRSKTSEERNTNEIKTSESSEVSYGKKREKSGLNPSLSDTSQESLPSDNIGGEITYHRYYHVFREGELDQLIEKYVENLHIISSYYDHASWCVVAEKVQVWTI